jgi:antibiotic biosynthesis monooxygenase (ABM) superfamily enzyme
MTFVEICIYEVKPDKTEEFEALLNEIAQHHRDFPGVVDVRYIKRTHRQLDFNAVK